MNNLIWFNDHGDALNIVPDINTGIYNGTLNFDPNSSDTFKTIGLYLFEKIYPITFDSIDGDTNLQRFQLFNENRFTFTGNTFFTQSVTNIEAINNHPDFYSKWIYGTNFESKYPIGSSIVFDTPIFEFTNMLTTYTVIGTKKGAIMVISSVNNSVFTALYGGLTFSNVSISGLNTIGIYDYIRGTINQLSNWNEYSYYSQVYDKKKLTIVNTGSQSVVTVENSNLFNRIYYNYSIDNLTYTQSTDLSVLLTLKSDLPNVYTGGVNITGNIISFSNTISKLLLPGTQFIINSSILNTYPITIAPISLFTGNINTIYYATQSQVLWNNIIYQSVVGYTQSPTSSINPDNNSYWTSSITYLPSVNTLTDEVLLNTTLHLTTNKLLFTQTYTNSNNVTMAYFAQNYASDFNLFNIDLTYNDGVLNSNLIYSSNYATVDYLFNGTTQSNIQLIEENILQTQEVLNNSINKDVSSNFKYSMVITNIDSYGISFLINDQKYVESADFVYVGLNIDQRKSIDRTLRNFLFNNFARLTSIGINILLESSIYYGEFDYHKDTIIFTTEYPNVPIKLAIKMGTMAIFYIKHSSVNFMDMGNYLNIKINGKDYGQKVISASSSIFVPDISTTVTNWVNKYSTTLYGYGILVSNVRELLYFNIVEPSTNLNYSIGTSKLPIPGINQYVIDNYITGHFGILIAGNEVVLSSTSSQDFELAGFATGMINAINNTVYPYDNQEYNIIYLDSYNLGLSYQGPFWNTLVSECNLSAFTSLAFSPLAYGGLTACAITTITASGAFNVIEFDAGFDIYSSLEDYYTEVILSNLDVTSKLGITNSNLGDILYINEFEKIYIGGYNISVLDANTFELLSIIDLPNNTGIKKIAYNSYNKYIYAITVSLILVIDPITDTFINFFGSSPIDIVVCQKTGDVYWTNSGYINIFNPTTGGLETISIILGVCGKLEYNIIDGYIYCVTSNGVIAVDPITKGVVYSIFVSTLNNNFIFTEPIYGAIYVFDYTGQLFKIINGSLHTVTIPLATSYFYKLLYDNFSGDMVLSKDSSHFLRITPNNTFPPGDEVIYQEVFDYGDMVVSQFDSQIYMVTTGTSSFGKLDIINVDSGNLIYTAPMSFTCSKVIYNPLRETVVAMSNSGQLCEIGVTLVNRIVLSPTASAPASISDGLFGTLDPKYVPKEHIWLKTRQYLRGPRANYANDDQAQIVFKFVDDQTPQIFMYDISGNQLTTGTSYSYAGDKPLPIPCLNSSANMDITKINDSSVQQTIFDEISSKMDYIDSSTDISILPTPIELFLGYNDTEEGYVKTTLKAYYRENVSYSIIYNSLYTNDIILLDMGTSSVHPNGYGIIQMNRMSSQSFLFDDNDHKTGLKEGQIIQVFITDVVNTTGKYISYNSGNIFIISQIYNTQIVVDYISDFIIDETTIIADYPNTGSHTYLNISFNVLDKEFASIDLYGQTEIEDIRYKVELYNSGGHNINSQDSYIFKTYDINEQGIDWGFLNKKRKEMLMVRSDIFPYVGSYKAIVNAINYFGYNDLELYEYYRNINIDSPNFYKLSKVEIPDIFDNNIVGFTVKDFLNYTMPNPNFEETNMFNLTYKITDKQGNNVLLYSLQEVIVKLQGLKNWLETNVIPITHKILDITGRTDFVGGNYIRHKSFSIKSVKINEMMTPIDFNLNEAYLMPINSGSTVYNVVLDFVSSKNGALPTNFSIFIRTYKTYLEWNPFTIYNSGDEVIYYGIIYKSYINTNQILDPRKYANIELWSSNIEYFDGQFANYNRHIYEYLGTQSSFIQFGTASVPTPVTTSSWLDISEWIIQDLVPVQTITEYRVIDSVTYSVDANKVLFYTASSTPDYLTVSAPFNFSIDSNIDPFLTISITSENGYGLNYTSQKNYEIRGLNDLFTGQTFIESIGPFQVITPVM